MVFKPIPLNRYLYDDFLRRIKIAYIKKQECQEWTEKYFMGC